MPSFLSAEVKPDHDIGIELVEDLLRAIRKRVEPVLCQVGSKLEEAAQQVNPNDYNENRHHPNDRIE